MVVPNEEESNVLPNKKVRKQDRHSRPGIFSAVAQKEILLDLIDY
jgi:hypothetical protein